MSSGIVVALTGGIACGKSEVAKVLQGEGAEVLDTDTLAHEMMEPGTSLHRQVVEAFGADYVQANGRINRDKLGELVFGNRASLRVLNNIVHPPLMRSVRAWAKTVRDEGRTGVVVVPLLHEIGETSGWDSILCVAASVPLVIARLAERGLDTEASRQRLESQMPAVEKAARSDYVICNEGTLESLEEMTLTVWKRITSKENGNHD